MPSEGPSAKLSQAERFREAARQIGADESYDALDRVMGKLDLKAKPKAHADAAALSEPAEDQQPSSGGMGQD